MRPILLAGNQPRQFYRGGSGLAAFRQVAAQDDFRPEDWIGSTTPRYGSADGTGLTTLADGRVLREAVRADPAAWLGAEHAEVIGPDPALLVKLLDAGESLPVHVHPSRAFAQRHLGCSFGKTEAWLVLAADGPDARFRLGFTRDIESAELGRWMADQDAAGLLDSLHVVSVRPGDTVLVPAGVPHAIGAGIFCLELQEPTDFSLMLEWAAFGGLDPARARLGLGAQPARECVDRTAISAERLARLRTAPVPVDASTQRLFPEEADPFFRAELIDTTAGAVELDAGFSILVVLEGDGCLDGGAEHALALASGTTALVPHSAGIITLSGPMRAVRCRPPSVEALSADGVARVSAASGMGQA